jgi:hypothetical protein
MVYEPDEGATSFLTAALIEEMLRSLEEEDVVAFLEQIGGDFSGYQRSQKLGNYLYEYFAHDGYPRISYLTDRVHQGIFERFLNSVAAKVDWTEVGERILANFNMGEGNA